MASSFRALVIEDEPIAREAAVLALHEEGFCCEAACDGSEGWAALARSAFDVVVTDLRMPKAHGHALAVDLAGRGQERPLVVVLTGVHEKRLIKDLIARGVDDVAFKPVDFDLFAAKVRALCERRQRQFEPPAAAPDNPAVASNSSHEMTTISADEIERRLDELVGAIPVSPTAIQVVNLIRDGTSTIADIARLIAQDPLLTMEVLRLANSACCAPGGQRIDDLQQAVTRVGERQISELAVASVALRAMSQARSEWSCGDLLWRRSIASSRAIQLIHPTADLGADDEGLFLASLLLPISRVLVDLAFPGLYPQLVDYCRRNGCTLASLERRILAVPPARAMAGMLARWKLSARLYKPLQRASDSYLEIAALTEPLRSKVEQLRIAELAGQLAVAQFEDWDEIEFPPPETMCRMRSRDLQSVVEEIRGSLPDLEADTTAVRRSAAATDRAIRYFKLAADAADWLAIFVDALGMTIERVSRDAACQPEPVLVNSLGVSPERLEWFLDDALPDCGRTLVCSLPPPVHAPSQGPAIQLPCSFRDINAAISKTASLGTQGRMSC